MSAGQPNAELGTALPTATFTDFVRLYGRVFIQSHKLSVPTAIERQVATKNVSTQNKTHTLMQQPPDYSTPSVQLAIKLRRCKVTSCRHWCPQ